MQLSQRCILFYESLTYSFSTIQPLFLLPKDLIKASPTATAAVINKPLAPFFRSFLSIIINFYNETINNEL